MSRRKLSSLEDYSRALKNGKGIGIGSDYLPWLRVNDVSSHGKSVKIQGIKTNRTHHLLSGIEERFFLQAEYHQNVTDIREQFPLLPLDLVVQLSAEADIPYPFNTQSKAPCVLTTDFLVTFKSNNKESFLAVAIKPDAHLKKLKIMERLEIERLWWEMLGIPWRLITEKQLDRQISQNIDWLSDPIRGRKALSLPQNKEQIEEQITEYINPGIYEWASLVNDVSKELKLELKQTAALLKLAIWNQSIHANLSTPIQKQGLIEIVESCNEHEEHKANVTINT